MEFKKRSNSSIMLGFHYLRKVCFLYDLNKCFYTLLKSMIECFEVILKDPLDLFSKRERPDINEKY